MQPNDDVVEEQLQGKGNLTSMELALIPQHQNTVIIRTRLTKNEPGKRLMFTVFQLEPPLDIF